MPNRRNRGRGKPSMANEAEGTGIPLEESTVSNTKGKSLQGGYSRNNGRQRQSRAGSNSSGSVAVAKSNAQILFNQRPDPWQQYKYSVGESFNVQAANGLTFKEIMIGTGAIAGKGELYIFSGKYDFFKSATNPALPDNLRFLSAYMFLKFQNVADLAKMLKKPINTALSVIVTPADLNGWLINYCTARHCLRLLQQLIVTPTNLSAKLADITGQAGTRIEEVEAIMDRIAGVPCPPMIQDWVDTCMAAIFAYDSDSPIIMIDPSGVPAVNLWDTNVNIQTSLTNLINLANTSLDNIQPTTNVLAYIRELFSVMYGLKEIQPTGLHLDRMCFEMWRTMAVNLNVGGARFQGPVPASPPNNDGMVPILVDRENWTTSMVSDIYLSYFRNPIMYFDQTTTGSACAAFVMSDNVIVAGLQNECFPVAVAPSFTIPTTLVGPQNGALWRFGDMLPWLDLVSDGALVDYRAYNGSFSDYSIVEASVTGLVDATDVIVDRMFGTGLVIER